MIEPALAELLKSGLGYVLFVLACGVIAVFWRRLQDAQTLILTVQKQADQDLAAVNEKRLEETKAVVLALERSTVSATDRAAAVQAHATAIENLTKGFAAMVITDDNSRQRFEELGRRVEERQGEQLRLLGEIGKQLNSLSAGK